MKLPIDLSDFKPLALDPTQTRLSDDQRAQLAANIQFSRDLIIFFTAVADAKGLGGHTGGPYDIVPEVMIADAFMRGGDSVVPYYFDEAGHRVAIQYLMAALNGDLDPDRLMRYREFDSKLPGHPERDFTPGVAFSSGRLGHMWPYVNGMAIAYPDRATLMFGSDGSQMEGNDAEAARLAVARNLNVKIIVDDNDVTIAGYPSEYLPGFSVEETLRGHGLTVDVGEGEDIDALYERMAKAVTTPGPIALINRRKMAPGIPGLEGTNHAHDVIKVTVAIKYFQERNRPDLAKALEAIEKPSAKFTFRGSSSDQGKNRDDFGKIVCSILEKLSPEQQAKVKAIDSDLEGSCGMHHIRKNFPDCYISSGVMERGNLSAAAGFGYDGDKQGIFATFAAFQEMCISEISMARLNHSNLLCHFSHSGCDDIADNTCHYGINNFYADGGIIEHDDTGLYYPADRHQFKGVLERIFFDPGLRFIYSTRSAVPDILGDDGQPFYGESYQFEPGKDDIIREGSAGYVVSYGEMLYRALDAVERLRQQGLDVGLVNKAHLNAVDDQTMATIGASGFVLVVEAQNQKTGLGSRFGTYLLERGLTPRYAAIGLTRLGNGGLWEHVHHQHLDPDSIIKKVESLAEPVTA
ncbi:MAG: transketolase [Phycisphaerae bacterium]|nr:transketolase [Phycisphaerae bacterium]